MQMHVPLCHWILVRRWCHVAQTKNGARRKIVELNVRNEHCWNEKQTHRASTFTEFRIWYCVWNLIWIEPILLYRFFYSSIYGGMSCGTAINSWTPRRKSMSQLLSENQRIRRLCCLFGNHSSKITLPHLATGGDAEGDAVISEQ